MVSALQNYPIGLTFRTKICIMGAEEMTKGMSDITAALLTIDKIIETPINVPSKEEAASILRSCGILDKNNKIKSAYKKIITEGSNGKNDSK